MRKRRIFILIVLLVLVLGVYVSLKRVRQVNLLQNNPPTVDRVGCQQDAKICPDGSGVGRTGPNCEFAECPAIVAATPVLNVLNQFTTEDLVKGWYYGDLNQKKIGTPKSWTLKDSGTRSAMWYAPVANSTAPVVVKPVETKPLSGVVYGETITAVVLGGASRGYTVYVPKSYKGVAVPMVMFFHGGLGNMDTASRWYGWEEKAEKEGFIAVFINGASKWPSGKFATWNAGNCCAYSRDNNINDVGVVKATISALESKYNINKQKIFATGFSNGGMFSYRLACDMTSTFRAIGAVSGTDNYDSCNPSKPISIIHIHALDDDHVLYNGGAGEAAFSDLGKVTSFTSVSANISKWLVRNSITSAPVKEVISNGTGAICDLYSSTSGIQVRLCTTNTGGHSWPGGKTSERSKATPSTAINATDVIWAFFAAQK